MITPAPRTPTPPSETDPPAQAPAGDPTTFRVERLAETRVTSPALQKTMITELAQASVPAEPSGRPLDPGIDGPIWGDFRLGPLLGKGAMGAVYRGVQVSLGRPVAIKALAPNLADNASFRQRFLLEARMVARINSPHVIQVYGAGVHDGQYFFAMEYVAGSDLAHRLQQGYQPSPQAALHLIIQAVRGLVAAGAEAIVHRDLKPANMMVTADGQLKLMDFGLVKDASDENGQTMAGTVMGTASYISPEQARGEKCDQRTDIYSLGVVFYELLTRRLPFTGGDATTVIFQHVHAEPRPPREVEPLIPVAYQAVVLKCLRKKPDDRYQSAMALLQDLEALAADPAAARLVAYERRQKLLLGGLAAAAVIGVGAAAAAWTFAARQAPATEVLVVRAPAASAAPVSAPTTSAVPGTPVNAPVNAALNPTAPAASTASAVPAAGGVPAVAVPAPVAAAPAAPPALTVSANAVTAAAETSAVVTVTAQAADAQAPLSFRWSLTGPTGAAGRLEARTTGVSSVRWSAPGRPGPVALAVVARDAAGHEASAQVALTAGAPGDARGQDLLAFARWGGDGERALSRLGRDDAGTWCATGADGIRVLRIAAGWQGASEVPNALAAVVPSATKNQARGIIAAVPFRQELYLLGPTAVAVLGPDGSHRRDLGALVAPSDLAIAADGTVYVADQGQGGVAVYEADGRFRCRLGRAGDGADDFSGLTRIALSADGGVIALDAAHKRIQRFDHALRRLPAWPVPAEAKADAVAVAARPAGVALLLANGQVLPLDGDGKALAPWVALADTGLARDPGRAVDLCVDAGGEAFVTFAGGVVARYGADGAFTGVRSAALHGGDTWSADGAGRLYQLDRASGWLYVCDSEGWRQLRLGGPQADHGTFAEAMAVAAAPDGSSVAVLDHGRRAVVRFDPAHPLAVPLVFGQRGRNNGQFDDPADLAVDEAGRTYVLDASLARVSVFDAKGVFLFAFGSPGRGADALRDPKLLAVSAGGDAAYVYDDAHQEIKKFTLDFHALRAAHVTNTGGRGDDLGQIRALVALHCDRLGLLYLADSSRGDVQVIDFRGNSAVPVLARTAAELGLRKVGGMGISPDGQVWVSGGDQLVGLGWVAK